MSPIIVNLIIVQVLVISVHGQCQQPWIPFGNSCYLFDDAQSNWFSAEFTCTSLYGGYLVEIESKEENEFIKKEAARIHAAVEPGKPLGYWIGGSDMENEGHFVWMNSKHSFNFTDWLPNQPDSSFGHEDCVHLYALYSYKWNDLTCAQISSFICEKRLDA